MLSATAILEIRSLVGTPYGDGVDPPGSLDCIALVERVYEIIGRGQGEPDRWRFPEGIDAARLGEQPIEALLDWYRWWDPTDRPGPGSAVLFGDLHVGVMIDAGAVLHTSYRRGSAEVLSRRAVRRFASGFFNLRQEPAAPDRSAEPVHGHARRIAAQRAAGLNR